MPCYDCIVIDIRILLYHISIKRTIFFLVDCSPIFWYPYSRQTMTCEKKKEGNMPEYSFGDYVIFDDGNRPPEIGRVTRDEGGECIWACYHEGCTAAATFRNQVRTATQEEIDACELHLGFHRFDDDCDRYDRDACFMCEHADKH